MLTPDRPTRRAPAALTALIALLLVATTSALGQTEPPPATDPPPTESPAETTATPQATTPPRLAFERPAATLRTFIEAMAEGDRARGAQALDLSLVSEDGAEARAQELYRTINRIEYLDFDDPTLALTTAALESGRWSYFPRPILIYDPGRLDLYRRQRRFELIRDAVPDLRIDLVREANGEWRFGPETVRDAGAYLEALQKAGFEPVEELQGQEVLTLAEWLESKFPDALVFGRFLGIKYWKWLTLLAVIFAGVVLDFVLRSIIVMITASSIRRRGGEVSTKALRRAVRPFGLAVAAILWLWAIRLLQLPDEALKVLTPAAKFFFILAIVWSAYRLTDVIADIVGGRASRTVTKFDDLLVPLVRKSIKVFITVFGLIYLADAINIQIGPLLAGLGIGGVGFAFAAKDTVEHFFGSVTVIADRPFEVGDWIVVGDTEGIVEEVGFRSTRVRTFYNSVVTVPNGNLVRAVVDNYGRRRYRRYRTHFTVTYGTTPDQVEAFCEGIREIIRLHPYTRKDYYQVWLHQLGSHSLDILVYMFFDAPDWNTELRERHRLLLDVMRLADRLGVDFAFPTQTLHVEQIDPERGHVPADAPDDQATRRAHAIGRRAVRAVTADAEWRHEIPAPEVVIACAIGDEDEEVDPAEAKREGA